MTKILVIHSTWRRKTSQLSNILNSRGANLQQRYLSIFSLHISPSLYNILVFAHDLLCMICTQLSEPHIAIVKVTTRVLTQGSGKLEYFLSPHISDDCSVNVNVYCGRGLKWPLQPLESQGQAGAVRGGDGAINNVVTKLLLATLMWAQLIWIRRDSKSKRCLSYGYKDPTKQKLILVQFRRQLNFSDLVCLWYFLFGPPGDMWGPPPMSGHLRCLQRRSWGCSVDTRISAPGNRG